MISVYPLVSVVWLLVTFVFLLFITISMMIDDNRKNSIFWLLMGAFSVWAVVGWLPVGVLKLLTVLFHV